MDQKGFVYTILIVVIVTLAGALGFVSFGKIVKPLEREQAIIQPQDLGTQTELLVPSLLDEVTSQDLAPDVEIEPVSENEASLAVISPIGGTWVKGLEYQVSWLKENINSLEGLKLFLYKPAFWTGSVDYIPAQPIEYLLKENIVDEFETMVTIPVNISSEDFLIKISGIADGEMIEGFSEQTIHVRDPSLEDATFTVNSSVVPSGGTITFDFAWPGAEVIKIYLDCPPGVTVQSSDLKLGCHVHELVPPPGSAPLIFTSLTPDDSYVYATLYGYNKPFGSYSPIGGKELIIRVLPSP